MEEEKTTLCYSLGEGLKGRKDSVSVRRYIARMKSEGSFRDADLWEAMAKETGRDADYIRYLGNLRWSSLGFGTLFEGCERETADMAWVSQYSNANMVKTDFFEAKSTAYAKSTALVDDL